MLRSIPGEWCFEVRSERPIWSQIPEINRAEHTSWMTVRIQVREFMLKSKSDFEFCTSYPQDNSWKSGPRVNFDAKNAIDRRGCIFVHSFTYTHMLLGYRLEERDASPQSACDIPLCSNETLRWLVVTSIGWSEVFRTSISNLISQTVSSLSTSWCQGKFCLLPFLSLMKVWF